MVLCVPKSFSKYGYMISTQYQDAHITDYFKFEFIRKKKYKLSNFIFQTLRFSNEYFS